MRVCALGLVALLLSAFVPSAVSFSQSAIPQITSSPRPPVSLSPSHEYLWYEAENMRGFGTKPTGEPMQNPSWLNLPRAKAPGWGINGPGVSAEWSQGGESEWNSAAASSDETNATIYQDIEVPRAGDYKLWVRYADWATKTENFVVRVTQDNRDVLRHEFGTKDIVDRHDEVSMYWQWAFAWDSASGNLEKGPARISITVDKAAGARRHVDSVLLTNDPAYVPDGRRKPDFAAMRYLRTWSTNRSPLSSLLGPTSNDVPNGWRRPPIAGRDFIMPWNIAPEFWPLYDAPAEQRPLYPFNAEPIDQFVQKYKGARDVPIFASRVVVPTVYLNTLPTLLKEGSPFLRYLRETKTPFAVLINYANPQISGAEGHAAWQLLNGELKTQFLGWISGESVGYVWDKSAAELKISPTMSRKELSEAHHLFYSNAIAEKWAKVFSSQTGPMWDKLIPAQSTSSTSFAHPLAEWGVNLLGMETAAVQPMFGMRIAFTRGAARQYGGNFLYYHAPNFGDTATTFTKTQNFAGPDNFFHSRYGATMGPSLSWYRKSYYLYYMAGASAIYLEQGHDQFFKPGPGEHDFQLNPLGRITDEFVRFAEKHPERGTPYTPVAFLLDPSHGWEMTDYPHWPFGVSQLTRHDRALRELFGVAYYPGLVVEGEPASGDRQAFVSGIFGDIFDVLVASEVTAATGNHGSNPPARNAANKQASKPAAKQPEEKTKAKPGNTRLDYEGSNVAEQPKPAATVATSAPDPARPTSPLVRRPPVLPLQAYRAIVVGGRIQWSSQWIQRLTDYVRSGGTVVINAAQIKGLPDELLGVKPTGTNAEADSARCISPGEAPQDLSGQLFRYEKIELKGAQPLITSDNGDPLVTVHKLGQGSVVFSALPDLLGEDERITPFAAHMLAHVFADATPLRVRGEVEYLINRNEKGWVVTLFNNNGVFKPQQGMAQVDRTKYVTATISLPSQQIQSASDWITDKPVEVKTQNGEGVVTVSMAPGGVSIVELRTR